MHRPTLVGVAIASVAAAAVLGWMGVRQEREYRRLIAAGDVAAARGQTFDAIEAYSGAAGLRPGSMLAYLRRGDAHRRRHELDAAVRDLTRAHALDPTAPQPLEALGDAASAGGDPVRAAGYYRQFLALDDRSAAVAYKLALALYRAGDRPGATDAARRALTIRDIAEAHYLLALCARDDGRPAEAIGHLQRAVLLQPGLAAARAELADLYAAHQRVQDAVEQLTALAALEPATPDRLVGVALAYGRLDRTEAAVLTLDRAAVAFPNAPAIPAALGRIWLEHAERNDNPAALHRALQVLQPLAEVEGASGAALALYGRALLASDRVQAAERVLRAAVERLPVDARTFDDLASASRRLGHADLARRAEAHHAALTCQRGC
jgi:tetratricopeptide (TPR) repeat protein